MGVDPITVLPYDILPNIFSQLPAIEIVRLQAVSRKWKTAINRLCTATWARRSLSPRDAEWRCEGGWDEFVGSVYTAERIRKGKPRDVVAYTRASEECIGPFQVIVKPNFLVGLKTRFLKREESDESRDLPKRTGNCSDIAPTPEDDDGDDEERESPPANADDREVVVWTSDNDEEEGWTTGDEEEGSATNDGENEDEDEDENEKGAWAFSLWVQHRSESGNTLEEEWTVDLQEALGVFGPGYVIPSDFFGRDIFEADDRGRIILIIGNARPMDIQGFHVTSAPPTDFMFCFDINSKAVLWVHRLCYKLELDSGPINFCPEDALPYPLIRHCGGGKFAFMSYTRFHWKNINPSDDYGVCGWLASYEDHIASYERQITVLDVETGALLQKITLFGIQEHIFSTLGQTLILEPTRGSWLARIRANRDLQHLRYDTYENWHARGNEYKDEYCLLELEIRSTKTGEILASLELPREAVGDHFKINVNAYVSIKMDCFHEPAKSSARRQVDTITVEVLPETKYQDQIHFRYKSDTELPRLLWTITATTVLVGSGEDASIEVGLSLDSLDVYAPELKNYGGAVTWPLNSQLGVIVMTYALNEHCGGGLGRLFGYDNWQVITTREDVTKRKVLRDGTVCRFIEERESHPLPQGLSRFRGLTGSTALFDDGIMLF